MLRKKILYRVKIALYYVKIKISRKNFLLLPEKYGESGKITCKIGEKLLKISDFYKKMGEIKISRKNKNNR